MFTIRPYRAEDAAACGNCLYEGFFSCPIDDHDRAMLVDYAQVLIEKCNFTYVAETEDHEVVGFICGSMTKIQQCSGEPLRNTETFWQMVRDVCEILPEAVSSFAGVSEAVRCIL